MRTYKLWIKGFKISTIEVIEAKTKADAIWIYAKRHEIKTIDIDGFWVK